MPLSNLGYLALKRQTASTPAVAVVPTHFLRFNEGDLVLEQENIELEAVQNNAFPTTMVAGGHTASAEFTTDLDANECVHVFAGALGTITSSTDISSATDGTVYSHQIDYAASLPVFSIEQGRGSLTDTANNRLNYEVRRAFGAQIDSWTIKGNGSGKLEFSWKAQCIGIFHRGKLLANAGNGASVPLYLDTVEGLVATTDSVNIYDATPQNEVDAIASLSATAKTITIATLGNSYTVVNNAMVFLEPLTPSFSVAPQVMTMADTQYREGATYTAAAATTVSNLESWELTFSNNLDSRPGTIRRGASLVAPKTRVISLKCTKYFDSRADAERYFSVQQRGMEVKISNNVIVSATDTNAAKYEITIALSNMRLKTYEMTTSYGELYAYDCEYSGLYDSSDARAIRITVKNASAGTVYTA